MSKPVIIRRSEAFKIEATAPAMAYGFGVFETLKLSEGAVCFWEQHWRRMMESAECLGLHCDCSANAALQALGDLVAADALNKSAIKLSLLRMRSGAQLQVYARDIAQSSTQVRLRYSRAAPLNERSPLAGHKTHNYMENWLLLEESRAAGYFDSLRLNMAGALAETTLANVFFVVDGVLHTPSLETGVLPGVIRAEVLRLARESRIPCKQGTYLASIIEKADCVFLTNSLQGMISVGSVQGEGLRALLTVITTRFLPSSAKRFMPLKRLLQAL